jgi:hypothetical protein
MFIQDEIKICIKAYKEALMQDKLTFSYLRKNSLEHGICHFADINKLDLLNEFINGQDFFYLCDTPTQLMARDEYNFIDIINKRIEYLENLIKYYDRKNNEI